MRCRPVLLLGFVLGPAIHYRLFATCGSFTGFNLCSGALRLPLQLCKPCGLQATRADRGRRLALRGEPQKITDMMGMRASEVKAFLKSKGIRVDDCFDAESLVERAISTEAQWGAGFTPGNPYASTPSPNLADAAPVELSEVEAAWRRICDAWPAQPPTELGQTDATMTLVMLHALGDNDAKFLAGTLQALLSQKPGLRIILPKAPVEQLQGQSVSTWFMPTNGQWIIDDTVARPVMAYVHAILRREMARGVQPHRIVVGGFAQGGGPAIRAALSFPDATLGGAVLLSHFFGAASASVSPVNRCLDVLVCHGTQDEMVPFSEGKRGADLLRGMLQGNAAVAFKEYDMKHGVNTEEIFEISKFLEAKGELNEPKAQEVAMGFDPVNDATKASRRPEKQRVPIRKDSMR